MAWVRFFGNTREDVTELLKRIPVMPPNDFDLQEGATFERAAAKLREKYAAETGWKQDVSNWPVSSDGTWTRQVQSAPWMAIAALRAIWPGPVGAKDLSVSLARKVN
ncbi:hypothetical protein ACHOLT_01990 [Desulfitobacterium sp. Sab5]|uniref:hypothetical protein n=1 Tax=Desulfitobacterium nosdiversum TaxID=3375356 RepID=UPI003CF336A8